MRSEAGRRTAARTARAVTDVETARRPPSSTSDPGTDPARPAPTRRPYAQRTRLGSAGPTAASSRLGSDEPRYTTPELLAARAARWSRPPPGRLDDRPRRRRPDASSSRSCRARGADRRAAPRRCARLTGSGHGVEVVVGRAGTGQDLHPRCRPRRLAAAAGIRGHRLRARGPRRPRAPDRLRHRLDHHRPAARPTSTAGGPTATARSVLVVDEAGMVGTRTLARLLDAARASRHEAGAGRRPPPAARDRRRRRRSAGLAQPPAGRSNSPTTAARHHRWEIDRARRTPRRRPRPPPSPPTSSTRPARGRRHRRHAARTARGGLVARRRRDTTGQQSWSPLRRTDVDDLNPRARSRLAAAGLLTGRHLQTAGSTTFQVGDRIAVPAQPPQPRGASTAPAAPSPTSTTDDRTLTFRRRRHTATQLRLPADYLDAGHVTHGYAITGPQSPRADLSTHTFVLGCDRALPRMGLRRAVPRPPHQPPLPHRHHATSTTSSTSTTTSQPTIPTDGSPPPSTAAARTPPLRTSPTSAPASAASNSTYTGPTSDMRSISTPTVSNSPTVETSNAGLPRPPAASSTNCPPPHSRATVANDSNSSLSTTPHNVMPASSTRPSPPPTSSSPGCPTPPSSGANEPGWSPSTASYATRPREPSPATAAVHPPGWSTRSVLHPPTPPSTHAGPPPLRPSCVTDGAGTSPTRRGRSALALRVLSSPTSSGSSPAASTTCEPRSPTTNDDNGRASAFSPDDDPQHVVTPGR